MEGLHVVKFKHQCLSEMEKVFKWCPIKWWYFWKAMLVLKNLAAMNLKIKSVNMDSWHLLPTSISRKLYCHSEMWKIYDFVTFMNIWRKCCARIGTTFIATSSVAPCEPSSVPSATKNHTILNCANLLLVDFSWIW